MDVFKMSPIDMMLLVWYHTVSKEYHQKEEMLLEHIVLYD
jgi:hypothetical protein